MADHAVATNIANIVNSSIDVNNGIWVHVILIIDRSLGIDQNKIFINGNLSFVQSSVNYANLNGNFVNNILYLGQRAGNASGFNGSIMKYQIFRAIPTDAQAMEMYLNEI